MKGDEGGKRKVKKKRSSENILADWPARASHSDQPWVP